MSQLAESEGRSPFHRANSLSDLLRWDDLDFVRCAYVTILGRQPDMSGQTDYAQRLRAGESKLDILWQLRRSPEAKQHDPGIAGLDHVLRRAAWQRRPFLGALSRFLRADADGHSRTDRALRSLMNAASVHERYLRVLVDRSAINLASSGDNNTTAIVQAGQGAESATVGAVEGRAPVDTPELNHLRQKRMMGRFADDIWR